MERENKSKPKKTIDAILRITTVVYIILWIITIIGCTNSLFIVKGWGNKVNQKAEQTTSTKVDSITTKVDTK